MAAEIVGPVVPVNDEDFHDDAVPTGAAVQAAPAQKKMQQMQEQQKVAQAAAVVAAAAAGNPLAAATLQIPTLNPHTAIKRNPHQVIKIIILKRRLQLPTGMTLFVSESL